jgi:hypothetical protein
MEELTDDPTLLARWQRQSNSFSSYANPLSPLLYHWLAPSLAIKNFTGGKVTWDRRWLNTPRNLPNRTDANKDCYRIPDGTLIVVSLGAFGCFGRENIPHMFAHSSDVVQVFIGARGGGEKRRMCFKSRVRTIPRQPESLSFITKQFWEQDFGGICHIRVVSFSRLFRAVPSNAPCAGLQSPAHWTVFNCT